MKFAVTSLAFVLAAAVGSAFAADATPAKPMTAQQTKMSTCSKDAHAKGLKGPEYKSFMSTCLKGGEAAATPTAAAKPSVAVSSANTPQRQKMKACSTEAKAKGLKGPDRRTFMSTCLKADAAPAAAGH
ncbi:MAG TPA: PsiF family protein [Rudaea sp.]|nr:PsiF family protein [Rudaea sp.]